MGTTAIPALPALSLAGPFTDIRVTNAAIVRQPWRNQSLKDHRPLHWPADHYTGPQTTARARDQIPACTYLIHLFFFFLFFSFHLNLLHYFISKFNFLPKLYRNRDLELYNNAWSALYLLCCHQTSYGVFQMINDTLYGMPFGIVLIFLAINTIYTLTVNCNDERYRKKVVIKCRASVSVINIVYRVIYVL